MAAKCLPSGVDYVRVAPTHCARSAPGVIFLHGLLSNKQGEKALRLEAHAATRGVEYVRFDYRGHGESSGRFTETCLGDWIEDATEVLLKVADGGRRQVLVGSSIGSWVALHLALAHPQRVAGLVLLAPAVDYSEINWARLDEGQRQRLLAGEEIPFGLEYTDHVRLKFYEDGRRHLLFGGPPAAGGLAVSCPVRIMHGVGDDVVPVKVASRLLEELASKDVHLTLVKDGDHRLSRPQDLDTLTATVDALLQLATA